MGSQPWAGAGYLWAARGQQALWLHDDHSRGHSTRDSPQRTPHRTRRERPLQSWRESAVLCGVPISGRNLAHCSGGFAEVFLLRRKYAVTKTRPATRKRRRAVADAVAPPTSTPLHAIDATSPAAMASTPAAIDESATQHLRNRTLPRDEDHNAHNERRERRRTSTNIKRRATRVPAPRARAALEAERWSRVLRQWNRDLM